MGICRDEEWKLTDRTATVYTCSSPEAVRVLVPGEDLQEGLTTFEASFGDLGNTKAKEEAEILQHLTALSKTAIYLLSSVILKRKDSQAFP